MSTSESDFDNDTSDDDVSQHLDVNDYYDDEDDFCEFEDVGYLTEVRDAVLRKHVASISSGLETNIPVDYSVRLAMNSKPESSDASDSSKPIIDDSLRMYLTAPPLFQRSARINKTCLSIDPTADESQLNNLSTPELYVGNIPGHAKYDQLKDWFVNRGHGVSRVSMKPNKKITNYAFVRFDSIATARDVLFLSETYPSNFVFQQNTLIIKRKQRNSPSKNNTNSTTNPMNSLNEKLMRNFKITDIYCGTLITGAAMRNIQRTKSIIANNDKFGIIAHQLIPYDSRVSSNLEIDTEKNKLIIYSSVDNFESHAMDISNTVKFEWNFHDLRGKRINPVLINKNQIYLLMEVKRPPIILETQYTSVGEYDGSQETRLPGNILIGHANAWLFRLSEKSPRSDYVKLIRILRSYNLSPRQFTKDNIVHSMSSEQAIRRNFDSVQLVSNDDWIKQNQDLVNDFFVRRWPKYPFETKFEIMKLISKHIITVNDLIADEQAEEILNLCTINTLVAVTDQILYFAPQCFSTTCDYEEDDWDTNTEQDQIAAELEEDSVPIVTDVDKMFSHIRSSATGASLNSVDARIPSVTAAMQRHSLKSSVPYLGTFTRLLLNALGQLNKHNRLRRLQSSGVYATRLELRTPNAYSSLIRKIYITPSTVLYEGPYSEEKCGVTREYEKYQDRFLRVTFRDEDYRTLHDYNDNMSKMYERIKDILKSGINICDRNYQFLAFSSSQLREHSCWMFAAPERKVTVDNIRKWMGDFSKIHPVAKYAARLGQLFSTSMKGLKLDNNQFQEINDYKNTELVGRHLREHCFTDGIGIISIRLAKKLAEEIKLSDGTSYPSAFQIRCGGFKGMVCVDIFNCIKNPNIDVYFRPSMNKFHTNDASIDVVRTSNNPTVAFLNRQIILLLSSLGVPDKNFTDLQDHMLEQLSALTKSPQEAIGALRELNEFGGNGFHQFLIHYIRRLRQFKEPFVWRLLHVIKAFSIKELRTKTKIRVQDSWSLLGIIDESKTLQYGQVFIQIDNSNQQKENPTKEIFRGPVVVTRNPCFHPGDIRKLEAVDIPAFHSLKNVIVFPMDGPRPHPKEMSGGDLDGDTFWISRHPKLIFPGINEEPFDYQGQEDEAKQAQSSDSKPHTINEVCNFFGEYIAADNLGLIANSHLVFADQLPEGAMSEKCLMLARMHSTAVDFAKNGVCAPQLTRELRPKEYPPYMEKRDKPVCQSKTILGTLYDQVKFSETDICINEIEEINATSSFPYRIFFIDENTNYRVEARILKIDYDRDVKKVMRQYGIRNEVEFVSGYILKFTSKQYIRETKLFDLRNEIAHAYRIIQDKYLKLFWQEFYQSRNASDDEEQLDWLKLSKQLTWKNQWEYMEYHVKSPPYEEIKKKGSAWFHVTYEPWMKYMKQIQKNRKKSGNRSQQVHPERETNQVQYNDLFSFAWLVYPVLLKIFQDKEGTLNITDENSKKKKKKKNKNKNKDLSTQLNTITNENH